MLPSSPALGLRIYIVDLAKNDQQRITEVLLKRFPVNPPATFWVIVRSLSEPQFFPIARSTPYIDMHPRSDRG
jgi:hypothetical protein